MKCFCNTSSYNNTPGFLQLIEEAGSKSADILLGGVSWYKTALQISDNLFWVDKFSGLQFTLIYRRLFGVILKNPYHKVNDAVDYKNDTSIATVLLKIFSHFVLSYKKMLLSYKK